MYKKIIVIGIVMIILGLTLPMVVWPSAIPTSHQNFIDNFNHTEELVYDNDTGNYKTVAKNNPIYKEGEIVVVRDKVKKIDGDYLILESSNDGVYRPTTGQGKMVKEGDTVFMAFKVRKGSGDPRGISPFVINSELWLNLLSFYLLTFIGIAIVIFYIFKPEPKIILDIPQSTITFWGFLTLIVIPLNGIPTYFLSDTPIISIAVYTTAYPILAFFGIILISKRSYRFGGFAVFIASIWSPAFLFLIPSAIFGTMTLLLAFLSSSEKWRARMKFAKSKYPESMMARKRTLPSYQPLKQGSMSIFEKPFPIENQQPYPQYQPQYPYQTIQQQPQPISQNIVCPNCHSSFQVSSPIRPLQIQCPYCKTIGTLTS